MTLVPDLLEATEEIETPKSFVLWAIMAAVSAILRKNVWYDKHAYKVYPNIYALIVGAAGLRKGFAISLAQKLVSSVNNTRIISGQNSIQGILKELSSAESNEDGSPMFTKAQAFICSAELANLLIEDKQAHTLLTELYDTHANEKEYKKTLKEGKTVLVEPCLTFLAASNQRLLMEALPPASYEGGLIGRTMVIEETARRCINSLTNPPRISIPWKSAADDLRAIAAIRGPFEFDSKDTQEYYDKWYNSFELEKIDDNTGTASRMQDHILKLAMIISCTKRLTRTFAKSDIDEAMDLCMTSTRSIKMVIGKQGANQYSRQTLIVLRELVNAPDNRVKKSALLRKHYGDFDSTDLGRIIDTLTQAGAVSVQNRDSETWFTLNDRVKASYENFLGAEK